MASSSSGSSVDQVDFHTQLTNASKQHARIHKKLDRLVALGLERFEESQQQRELEVNEMLDKDSEEWIGGFRPSKLVRFVFNLIYSFPTPRLEEAERENLKLVSMEQRDCLNKILEMASREEEYLSNEITDIQNSALLHVSDQKGESEQKDEYTELDLVGAIEIMESSSNHLVEKANSLRSAILAHVVEVLSPVQAVELLIAAKKLEFPQLKLI